MNKKDDGMSSSCDAYQIFRKTKALCLCSMTVQKGAALE